MKLKAPTMISFEKKINNSDATMHQGLWSDIKSHDQWDGIKVQSKTVLGTISNRIPEDQTEEQFKKKLENANIQALDSAQLSPEFDTLKIQFSLRILGGLGRPHMCNSKEYTAELISKIDQYINDHGTSELAFRYACNLASGRFLWRNRVGSEDLKVIIDIGEKNTLEFNCFDFNMNDFNANKKIKNINKLSSHIESGFVGELSSLNVSAFSKLGFHQEVYPSQEFVESGDGKVLYASGDIASIHSQKIGNAIRTIDSWYAEEVNPIAVEAYGSVVKKGEVNRFNKTKSDFYSLIDKWILTEKELSDNEKHYVVAMLIRGGVFSMTKKKGK